MKLTLPVELVVPKSRKYVFLSWVVVTCLWLVLPVWLGLHNPKYGLYLMMTVIAACYVYLSKPWSEPSRPDILYPTGIQLLWRQRKYKSYGPLVLGMRCIAVLFIRWKWDGADACFMPGRGDLALVMFRYFVFVWYKESDPVFGIEDTKYWPLVTPIDYHKIEKHIIQIELMEQLKKVK